MNIMGEPIWDCLNNEVAEVIMKAVTRMPTSFSAGTESLNDEIHYGNRN